MSVVFNLINYYSRTSLIKGMNNLIYLLQLLFLQILRQVYFNTRHFYIQNFCQGNPCPGKYAVCQIGFTTNGFRCACREGYIAEQYKGIFAAIFQHIYKIKWLWAVLRRNKSSIEASDMVFNIIQKLNR